MIGYLLYLTTSHPDIMFSVCLCARFQANPKESHLITVKRIMKYLKGTTNVGLWNPKGNIWNLIGYSGTDYTGSKTDRKRTSGTCHILGNALVSWACIQLRAYGNCPEAKKEYQHRILTEDNHKE